MTLCRYLKRASFLCRTCSHVLTTSQSQTRTALIPIPNQKTRRIPLLSSPHFANRVRGGVSSDRCLPCAFSAACILRRSVRRANCIPSNTCRNIGLRFPIEWVWRSETFCPSCRPNKCDCNSREVRSTSTRRQHRRTLSISVSCWRWRYQIGWWGGGGRLLIGTHVLYGPKSDGLKVSHDSTWRGKNKGREKKLFSLAPFKCSSDNGRTAFFSANLRQKTSFRQVRCDIYGYYQILPVLCRYGDGIIKLINWCVHWHDPNWTEMKCISRSRTEPELITQKQNIDVNQQPKKS